MFTATQILGLLSGYEVNKNLIQSCGNMVVIPIIGETEFTPVADVSDVRISRDPAYDKLEFTNSSGEIGIAMQGYTIITEQKAQDRVIPYAHLVEGGKSKVCPANCIQSTQGGHFNTRSLEHDDFMILPPSLRSIAINLASFNRSETGALWEPLGKWVNGVDCNGRGLRAFYQKFEDRLGEFVAQFEPIKHQLGSVVVIDGRVVAIDLMPKYSTWKSTWRALIRDSYGAEAVRTIENGGAVSVAPLFDVPVEGDLTMDALEAAFNDSVDSFHNDIQSGIMSVLQTDISPKVLDQKGELSLVELTGPHMVGQGVIHGDSHYVYLSLVAKDFNKKAPRKKFKSLRTDPYGDSGFKFS
ncbi:MAG: hypothetical protein KAS32_26835 [Candidatus Peribacteraceae bacterium]|nr:hypothetical protein [Candidatus Peribacteraceae bacterium]